MDERAWGLFFELFSGLPRQGPGGFESTRRALSMIPLPGAAARILDIGCGTGAQTLDLARLTPATIVAVDLHAPYVDELNAAAARSGVEQRVQGRVGDMKDLGVAPRSVDLIWSEGAVYSMGFDAGLEAWRGLVKPGGHVAVSELCWFEAGPAGECARFFAAEYPAMRDVPANRAAVQRIGYELVGDFPLPASAWWGDYYEPLQRNLAAFRERHEGDPVAESIAAQSEREIKMHRRYSESYGYAFFVLRVPAEA